MKSKHSRLLLPVHLLLCLPAMWMLATAADAPAGQRPGCPTKCGDVDIPFPFGIGEQCALHSGFQLNCTTVNGITKPLVGNIEVTKISVPDGKVWMKIWMSRQCYIPATGLMDYSNDYLNLANMPFWISEVDNKIVVVGGNTLAYMISSSYVIGCSSTCQNVTLRDGSCSGTGCCQVDVPKDIQKYHGYFNEDYNTTEIWRYSRCSYMALMENESFKFKTSYVNGTVFYETYKGKVPVVMNWQIGPSTCDVAQKNMSSYACVSSGSECVNSTNEPGYRCNCSRGYKGNPYLRDGCQDINECLDNVTYPCPGICENTPGSHSCKCHPGNSMSNGVCTPIQNGKSAAFVALPVVGASVGILVLVSTIACVCLIQERRKLQNIKQKFFQQHGGLLLLEEMRLRQDKGNAFKIFSEEELQQATNRFSEQRVLGHGGHGTVYKGVLKGNAGNMEVAVKRCKTMNEKHKKEFGKEMVILSQINHTNIVKLLGCCLEVEVPMLVYEFMPNGTLFELIHGNHNRYISLATRLQIAHESAEALAYLHASASPPIIHGDIKSSNILLDGDHKAKVSDFGASILAPTDESQFVSLVQGTCGYLDPEYMQTCKLTYTSDVYSFGVVLLELLTGKKALNLEAPEHEKSLSMQFLSAMKENRLEKILDYQIKGDDNTELLEEIAELAKQCLEMCVDNRPSMKEIAEKLGKLKRVMQHPWAQQSPEEMQSLLGESSSMVLSTEYFSIEKKAVAGLESGR